MKDLQFYRCNSCGNIIGMIVSSGVAIRCCSEPMQRIVANVVDASEEMHVPDYKIKKKTVEVTIGAKDHPMEDAHYIKWVAIQTKQGVQRKELQAGNEPKVKFSLTDDDELLAIYAYCNVHGLWKKTI